MPDRTNLIYGFDGTFEGFLTCVFESYEKKEIPNQIGKIHSLQLMVDGFVKEIVTDFEKSQRVMSGIEKKAGSGTVYMAYSAFLHENEKYFDIYHYIRFAIETGKNTNKYLTNDFVHSIHGMSRAVGGENHKLKGFLRFAQMEGGVMYARITPKHNVLEMLTPHFVSRYRNMPFIIHDASRKTAVIYDMKEWYKVDANEISLPNYTENEKMYQQLWKKFFDTIAIEGRKNPRCQMTMMPKRFWDNMIEMR